MQDLTADVKTAAPAWRIVIEPSTPEDVVWPRMVNGAARWLHRSGVAVEMAADSPAALDEVMSIFTDLTLSAIDEQFAKRTIIQVPAAVEGEPPVTATLKELLDAMRDTAEALWQKYRDSLKPAIAR